MLASDEKCGRLLVALVALACYIKHMNATVILHQIGDLLERLPPHVSELLIGVLIALFLELFPAWFRHKASWHVFSSLFIGIGLSFAWAEGYVWCMPIVVGLGLQVRSWWRIRGWDQERVAKGDTHWSWIITSRLVEFAIVMVVTAACGWFAQSVATDALRDLQSGQLQAWLLGVGVVSVAFFSLICGFIVVLKASDVGFNVECRYRYPRKRLHVTEN